MHGIKTGTLRPVLSHAYHETTRSFGFGGLSKRKGQSIIQGFMHHPSGLRNPKLYDRTNPLEDNYKKIHTSKYPKEAAAGNKLGGNQYFLRDTQGAPLSFFQFDKTTKHPEHCVLTSTDKKLTDATAIETNLIENTSGFTTQIILEGRGVRASFEPAWPMLMIRMGNGVKVMDVSRHIKRHAGEVKVHCTPRGDAITIHGYNKAAVSETAIKLFKYVHMNPYTGKGGYLQNHPIKMQKSKKG